MDGSPPSPAREPFGWLLTLDLYACKEGTCADLSLCYRFLEALVKLLNMTMQAPPFLFRSPEERFPDKAGLSGWVPLIESGIQIHTLTKKNFISIDVYCCRAFSTEHIIELAHEFFAMKEAEMSLVERGLKYHEVA